MCHAYRIQAHTLLSAVVQYSASDPDDFVLLTAISDSRGFNELPSWEQPQYIPDRCFVGAHAHCKASMLLFAVSAGCQFAQRRAAQQRAPACGAETRICALAATAQKPAADTAAQVATALALMAHYFRTSEGTGAYMRGALADACEDKAKAAYDYAKRQFNRLGKDATCSFSEAASNCIGNCTGAATPVRCVRYHDQARVMFARSC